MAVTHLIEDLIPGLRGNSLGSSLSTFDLSGVTTLTLPSGTTLQSGGTLTLPTIAGGLLASGSVANDFSASTGAFKTSTGAVTMNSTSASTLGTTSANLTVSTTTSGTLAVTSAGLLTLTGVGASVWTPGAGATIVSDATTGITIGTATTQKLGFYNATPVVQQVATTDLGVALSNLGLRATGTAYPVTTSGAVTLTGGAAISGAASSINASSNFATNINTGTSTGAVTIGNSAVGIITIAGAANTAAEVLLTDGANNYYAADTRTGVTGVTVHKFTATGASFAGAAGNTYSLLGVPAYTLTQTGSTGVTALAGLSVLVGSPTVTDASALTVTTASAAQVNGPLPGGSVTFTNSVALDVPTYVTNGTTASGIRIAAPSGAGTNYALNVTSGSSQLQAVVQQGKTTTYNGIATTGTGLSMIVASSNQTAQVAALTNTINYTPPASVGVYRLHLLYRPTTTGASTSVGVTIVYKDSTGTVTTTSAPFMDLATTSEAAPPFLNTGAATKYMSFIFQIDNSATAITVSTTGTFTGTTYNFAATLEQLV